MPTERDSKYIQRGDSTKRKREMGEVAIVRSCAYRKRQWYITREEIAHRGREKWERLQL